jgi:hypothetical protein
MTPHTQTTFGTQGNCWQYAVASLLDVDPLTLPDQSKCDVPDAEGLRQQPYFQNLLGAYLKKHHGLAYVEVHYEGFASLVTVREPGWHFLTGTTVRTGTPGAAKRHVVVARYGEMVWDPHPSRAGLLDEINLALLMAFPKSWESHWRTACECPACAALRAA